MSASLGPPPAAASEPARQPAAGRKPGFALFVATACGLGYIPKAPGTFGSLAGLALASLPFWILIAAVWIAGGVAIAHTRIDPFLFVNAMIGAATAAVGVWASNRAASFWQQKDPQRVVIDEVSGQHLTLLLGCAFPVWWRPVLRGWGQFPLGAITLNTALSWKYLLVGFILFRVFDIWKPFPARQAESLPGGWGIMADDWVAAVYAGIGLWIARAAGL